MRFTFKRDEKGEETVHVMGACVARFVTAGEDAVGHKALDFQHLSEAPGVDRLPLGYAIELASDAGFWDKHDDWYIRHEVHVDVSSER